MLDVYTTFAQNYMATPVLRGVKTENERFAGALETYCIEALMQDGKALQAGTSHFLGQNFAKAFDVKYLSKENKQEYVWATSWGVSTRLMGALIMTHSDDQGLVLPPKLAPFQVVIVPIYRKGEEMEMTIAKGKEIKAQLERVGIRVKLDDRDTQKPGFKFAEWELKGVPLRIAIGPRDIQNNTVEMARRDTLTKEFIPMEGLHDKVLTLLDEIQDSLYNRALKFRDENTYEANTWDEFKDIIANKGGFVMAHWDGTSETENRIKDETKASIRSIPLDYDESEEGKCIFTGKPSKGRVVFAKAY
jgi:prolyl-tRNA synthetase